MATLFLHVAVFQLLFLWKDLSVEGNNSSVLFNNRTSPTSSNGIKNQLIPTNTTSNSSSPVVSKSTTIPTTHVLTTTGNTTQPEVIPLKPEVSSSAGALPTADASTVPLEKTSTKPVIIGPSTTNESDDEDGIPFWVYILIAFGVIFVITIIVFVIYARLERWKNQGSYMVWDDNELELSPAFTRESEFLLDNLATNQEPGTPELQIYEIPLDSLGHQRVYIGTKRVAPKTDEHKEAVRFTKNKKSRKKDAHQFQGNTLPRTGRRDHIYSSVNDEVSSTLSEGDLFEGRNVHGHTMPTVILSSQTFGKSSSLKPVFNGRSPSPEEFEMKIRSFTLGSRTKSVSNIFQNRPLPPAPSKRFSKSLDRLRFFEASQNKGKSKTYPSHQKSHPIRAHPMLVKSSSFGGTYNQIISGSQSQPPVPPPRKGSVDFRDKSAAFDVSDVRKTNLCHRHSKSLDTLLLLREINWTAFDVDIYHSYESVHGNQLGENNNIIEPSYASVTSDEKPSSGDSSGRISSQSKTSTRSGSPIDADTPLGDGEEDHPYASVSEDSDRPKAGSLNGCDQQYSNRESDARDSGVSSSILEPDSDPTSPYASVRISQIPGLVVTSQYRSSLGEDSNYGEVFEKEDSGSSIGTCKDLKDCIDSKRSSTHTYLELIPDSGRNSVISETSSGYARPIDVVKSKSDASDNKDLDSENRKSLTDLEIPSERSATLESTDSGRETLEKCLPDDPCACAYDNEGSKTLIAGNSHNLGGHDQVNEPRDSSGESDSRVSQLSSRELQGNGEDDNVTGTKIDPENKGTLPSAAGEHVYENADYIQNLRNRESSERSEPTNSDAVVTIQGFNLHDTRHTDEFVV